MPTLSFYLSDPLNEFRLWRQTSSFQSQLFPARHITYPPCERGEKLLQRRVVGKVKEHEKHLGESCASGLIRKWSSASCLPLLTTQLCSPKQLWRLLGHQTFSTFSYVSLGLNSLGGNCSLCVVWELSWPPLPSCW